MRFNGLDATMDLSRRQFLHGLCGLSALVALGAAGAAMPAAAAMVRPPGGQDDERLEALCLKCNKCLEACPTDAVDLARLEDGLLAARTPVLNFRLGHCTFCGRCVEVCPSGALRPYDAGTVRLGLAVVDADNCIAWQWGGCTACKVACKYGAIVLDGANRPVVLAEKCNGCGQCEFVCPAAKLRSFKVGQGRGIVVRPPEAARPEPARRGA